MTLVGAGISVRNPSDLPFLYLFCGNGELISTTHVFFSTKFGPKVALPLELPLKLISNLCQHGSAATGISFGRFV